ncbi:TPA: 50S ribosomal protein L24 [Candidatus Dependentiae bacterium]|nr:MAG: 50S ribosomal protein L24 [candidate division TM6 bacterium GW2011_GWF2_43_87]HBL98455.1 50S ribosomal protein L24 [Candidatus Dependentiae bacterium]
MNIKKNDMVVVITGSDKGKKGAVVDILSKKGKIKVQNVAVVTRHLKARRQGEKPGIRKQERWIDVSNVKRI